MQDWMRGVTMDALPDAHRRLAEVIGVAATLELCDVYGGSTVYVPMNDAVYNVTVRDREIQRRYLLGAKIAQLAAQYGMSDRSVLRIVETVRPGQTNLFEDDATSST